jgi:hypothetical protein
VVRDLQIGRSIAQSVVRTQPVGGAAGHDPVQCIASVSVTAASPGSKPGRFCWATTYLISLKSFTAVGVEQGASTSTGPEGWRTGSWKSVHNVQPAHAVDDDAAPVEQVDVAYCGGPCFYRASSAGITRPA